MTTCRQCEKEAMSIFWEVNTLSLNRNVLSGEVKTVVNVVGEENALLVRNCSDSVFLSRLEEYLLQVEKLEEFFPNCKSFELKIFRILTWTSLEFRMKYAEQFLRDSMSFAASFIKSHGTLVKAVKCPGDPPIRPAYSHFIGFNWDGENEFIPPHFVTQDYVLKPRVRQALLLRSIKRNTDPNVQETFLDCDAVLNPLK
jgi:hypothetical protein